MSCSRGTACSGASVEERGWGAAAQAVAERSISPEAVDGAPVGFYAADNDSFPVMGELAGLKRPSLYSVPGLKLGIWTFDDFDHNKADLKPEHRKSVDVVARSLISLPIKSPASKILITGHTGTTGTEKYN
jgi:outer membrane protein OmpA-like peptidoglycan-associated protein